MMKIAEGMSRLIWKILLIVLSRITGEIAAEVAAKFECYNPLISIIRKRG